MRTRLDSAAKIGRFQGPLLQCHGDADTIVPFALGERLHAAAGEPKQLVVIRGGDHNDALLAAMAGRDGRFLRSTARLIVDAFRRRESKTPRQGTRTRHQKKNARSRGGLRASWIEPLLAIRRCGSLTRWIVLAAGVDGRFCVRA